MYIRRRQQSVQHHGAGRFLMIAAVMLTACGQHDKALHFNGAAQGTYYTVSYYDAERHNLQPMVDSMLDAFDRSVSLWVDSSLLRQLNAGVTDSLDEILLSLLDHSLAIERYTDGAFNCRVGRLVQAWGFSFRQRSEPDSLMLARMVAAAHAPVSIAGKHLVRTDAATELDFNAIAQGYSVDLLAAAFEKIGVHDYIIDVGGEVTAHGCKSGGKAWRVGIERPSDDSVSVPQVMNAIEVRDAAVVTSGSYRKYYERDGMRYSHTIDPVTGRPVQHTLLSVTVVDSACWQADAMATAYMVMGLEGSLSFIDEHRGQPGTGAVMFIYADGDTLRTYMTPEFKKMTI